MPGRLRIAWLLGLLVVAAVGTSAAVYFRRVDARNPLIGAAPLTSLPGREFAPAISPDGSRVAFLWDGGEEKTSLDLYVQAIGAASPVKLAAGSVRQPVWSPDGNRIAFLRYTDGADARRQEVLEVPASGGVERRLAVSRAEQYGLAWSPDGSSLAIVDKPAPGQPDAIYIVSTRDGSRYQLTVPPSGDVGDCLPRFSPDGRLLAFVRVSARYFDNVYVIDVRARTLTRLTEEEGNILGAPDWLSDGELIYSSAQRRLGGIARLWRATADGRQRQLLGDGFEPSVSRSARPLLVYVGIHIDWNVWRLPGPLARPGTAASRLVASTQIDANPLYSPDGAKIAFISNQSGMHELWLADANGANPTRLTFLDSNNIGMTASWSYDSQHLVFSAAVDNNADIYVIPATGGFPRRVTQTAEDERFPSFSRDGRWIYFSSRKSGSDQVWRVPRGGGPSVQITQNGGIDARESPDARFLYFTKALLQVGPQGVWRKPLPSGSDEKIADAGQAMQWTLVDDGPCYVKGPRDETASVECLDAGSRSIRWSTQLDGPAHLWGSLSVSPDQRWLLMDRWDRHDADLMMAANFK